AIRVLYRVKKDCLKLHLKPKENIFIKMLVFFTKTQQNFVVLIVKYYMKPFIFHPHKGKLKI
ncbi:hypothetical protein, partial [Lactococcus cremoris]